MLTESCVIALQIAGKNLSTLAFMQGQRYFIERAFQDAKQQTGMNQYQVRGYAGWYRHITMSMLAMQFLTEEKLRQKDIKVYLTSADIINLFTLLLPKKNITLKDLQRMIKKKNKHAQRLVKYSKSQ